MTSWHSLDLSLFQLINSVLTHPWLDLFFPFLTDILKNKIFVGLSLLLLIVWISRKEPIQRLVFVLGTAVLTSLADSVAGFIKPFFGRPRPFQTDLGFDVILRVPEVGSLSFPSGHATDAFFFATFMALHFPRTRLIVFPFAIMVAYSRVYCGVHYPTDVLAGAVLGSCLAIILNWGVKLAVPFLQSRGVLFWNK